MNNKAQLVAELAALQQLVNAALEAANKADTLKNNDELDKALNDVQEATVSACSTFAWAQE